MSSAQWSVRMLLTLVNAFSCCQEQNRNVSDREHLFRYKLHDLQWGGVVDSLTLSSGLSVIWVGGVLTSPLMRLISSCIA